MDPEPIFPVRIASDPLTFYFDISVAIRYYYQNEN